MRTKPRIVILGAGPAGLGAALNLAERGLTPILLEREDRVGGNAASFEIGGLPVDLGSHRLHPATDPEILSVLQGLLGPDLIKRHRKGRILLRGRWIHFPLRAADLIRKTPPAFLLGAARDLLKRLASTPEAPGPGPNSGIESFETVLLRGLGPTICRDFYFPYARKIWGLEPSDLSAFQAKKRVYAGTPGRLLGRLIPTVGGRARGKAFYYPRGGFGQISEALMEAASKKGATVHLGATVRRVSLLEEGFRVEAEGSRPAGLSENRPSNAFILECDQVWSTLPLPVLVQVLDPPPPASVLEAGSRLLSRAMVLVYLLLDQDRFTPYDAHYVPAPDLLFTRISEPKNYSGRREPVGKTVLCVEIPCSREDPLWTSPPSSLTTRVREAMARAGLPIESRILDTVVRRLPDAYPICRRGYESHLQALEEWIGQVPGLVSFGRQGLFAHDNTHHALFMGRSAVECLRASGEFDPERWAAFRKVFATHVVED